MSVVSGEIIKYLKGTPNGPQAVAAIKERVASSVEDLNNDPMTARLLPILRLTKFEGSILDAGCFGGWLYGYLGRPKGYTGIDKWPSAIRAAKELFPDGDFRECNIFDFNEKRDFVWCSQLIFADEGETARAHDKLLSLGEHGLIVYRIMDARFLEGLPEYDGLKVFKW